MYGSIGYKLPIFNLEEFGFDLLFFLGVKWKLILLDGKNISIEWFSHTTFDQKNLFGNIVRHITDRLLTTFERFLMSSCGQEMELIFFLTGKKFQSNGFPIRLLTQKKYF